LRLEGQLGEVLFTRQHKRMQLIQARELLDRHVQMVSATLEEAITSSDLPLVR
jgi:DNA-binding transcriptional LysR family regulator